MESLNATGVTLRVLNDDIDTSSPHGDAIRAFLAAIVEFERQTVREKQFAGIAKAKKEGRYKGRKPTARAKSSEVTALNSQCLTRQKIADELEIGVASVYRILKANTQPKKSKRKIVKKPEPTKQRRVKIKPTHGKDAEQLSLF